MKYPQNYVSSSNLRLEIAIAQQDIDAHNPGKCEFVIPTIMTESKVGPSFSNNTNIINKTLSNSAMSIINSSDTITLYVPKEYTVFYGKDTIPKGTRFIVSFIGGNINDIRIIGRYDNCEDMEV